MNLAKTIALAIALFGLLNAPMAVSATKKNAEKCVYVLYGRCCAYIKNGYCYSAPNPPSPDVVKSFCKSYARQPSNAKVRNWLKENRIKCPGLKIT